MTNKIQIKSWLTGSVLFEFEKEKNTVKETVLEALKQKANLSSADLHSANLRSASTDKRYIQISCIGSAKRMTTYCFDDDIVWCGCFKGSLDEFENQVIETHGSNEQYLKEYSGFIGYLRSLK